MHVLRSNCAQLANGRAFGALAAAIRSLFANNEKGVWYDPSDFSTMFQDAAGTTPVTAVGQPVGCILDKSGRGNHATQATATSRPTLQQDSGGRYYLLFDGVDDWLQTGSIDFTSTDKMTVVAGVRKLSDAAVGIPLEVGTDTGTVNGSFMLVYPNDPSLTNTWRLGARGSATVQTYHNTSAAAPSSDVFAATFDLRGASPAAVAVGRRNGVASTPYATSGTNAGTGNFASLPLYIGLRNGASFPFNGHIYQLIVRGALTSDVARIEQYVNLKTGAY